MRTKISWWVYRIFLLLWGLSCVRSISFAYQELSRFSDFQDERVVQMVTSWGFMEASLLLCVITLSLILRSGASVWLFGWMLLANVVPLVLSVFSAMAGESPVLLGIIIAVLALVIAIISGVFAYLIKTGELRKP